MWRAVPIDGIEQGSVGMMYGMHTRRGFLVSALLLSGCQSTGGNSGVSKIPTDEFDGKYEIYIGRFGRNTALQRSKNEVGTESELARLTVQSVGGHIELIAIEDRTRTSPNYQDLNASFSADGVLSFDAFGNILFNRRETRRLKFDVEVGDDLKSGGAVEFLVDNWDEHWAASIKIRKI